MVKLVNSEPQYLSHIMTELGSTLAIANPDILKLLGMCFRGLIARMVLTYLMKTRANTHWTSG
jgi:hypothetical protein